MISDLTRKLLVASKVRGVGKKTVLDLAQNRLFFELSMEDWHLEFKQLQFFTKDSPAFSKALASAEKDLEFSERLDGHILSVRDPQYPHLLRNLRDRPPILFLRGNPELFSQRAVAVVGTREPSMHGRATAERVTKYFADRDWQIVSGLAVGLDSVAHVTALSAGASTVAVLAHGLDSIYPKQNAKLASQIIENNGILVSEYPYGTPSFPAHFVERDRIQAALALGVIMIQSDETGGSWHASRAALAYGRPLFVPEPTSRDTAEGHPKSRGNFAIANGSTSEKLAILKCAPESLSLVSVIRSKDDYPTIEKSLLKSGAET